MADYDLQYQDTYIDALLATANELKTAGYIYKGVATPSTNPGTPTERVAYLASEPGTYTNFGGIVIASGLYSLTYASGTWTGTQMQAGSDIEVVQTTGDSTSDVMSQKAVTDEFGNVDEEIKIIGNKEKDVESITAIMFDVSTYAKRRYAISSSTLKYSPSYNVQEHILIPVTAGKKYVITAGVLETWYAWTTSSVVPVAGGSAPVSTVDNSVYNLSANSSVVVTAPSDAKFVYLRTKSGDGNCTPKSFVELYEYDGLTKVVDFNDYTSRSYTIGETEWTSQSRSHRAVPVPEGAKYINIVAASSALPPMFFFLKGYTIPSTSNLDPDFCEGYERRIQGGGLYALPEDCTYIAFAEETAAGNRLPYPVMFFNKLGLTDRVNNLEQGEIIRKDVPIVQNSAAWTGASTFEVALSTYGLVYQVHAKNTKLQVAVGSNTIYYYYLKSFKEPANGEAPDFCSGFEARRSLAYSGTLTLPSDCQYVFFGLHNDSNTSATPSSIIEIFALDDDLLYGIDDNKEASNDFLAFYQYLGKKIDLKASSLVQKYKQNRVNVSYTLGTYSSKAQQSFAAFAGYGFVWYDTGLLKVINMSDYSLKSVVTPVATNYANNHAGNANFGTIYYDEADVFPLLYLSSYLEYKCYVLRIVPIVNEDGSYSFNSDSIILVQTIYLYQDGVMTTYGHFYPTDDGFMYIHKWVNGVSTYLKFAMPTLADSVDGVVNLDYANKLDEFVINTPNKGLAGQVCRNGMIYALCYWKTSHTPKYDEVIVIDATSHGISARIPITFYGLNSAEFEGIEIYDGKICIGYNGKNYIGEIKTI